MKKLVSTALAASLIAAAGAAQAVTVVEKDGFSYSIGGEWQIQLRQQVGDDQDMDVEYDDLEIRNAAAYKLSDNLTAFGELDWGAKNAADKEDYNELHLEEAYLGFQFNQIKVLVGKTDDAADGFGVADYQEAVINDDAFDAVGNTGGDDLIQVSGDFGGFSFITDYEISADSADSGTNGEYGQIRVGYSVANFSLGATYQNNDGGDDADDTSVYGISLAYDAGVVMVGADYSEAEDEVSVWNAIVAVPVQDFTFKASFQSFSYDDDATLTTTTLAGEDVNCWYLTAIYTFPAHSNVNLFAEISDSDADDTDMGYLFGMRLHF